MSPGAREFAAPGVLCILVCHCDFKLVLLEIIMHVNVSRARHRNIKAVLLNTLLHNSPIMRDNVNETRWEGVDNMPVLGNLDCKIVKMPLDNITMDCIC